MTDAGAATTPSDASQHLPRFNNPLLITLLLVGGVKLALGKPRDALVIWSVTVTNAVIGFVQESKAESAIAALARSAQTEVEVVRGGVRRRLASQQLVPGDLVRLEAGSRVPADLRLVQSRNLHTDGSSLTGESLPLGKSTTAVEVEAPLAERIGMAYAGSFVTAGQGLGLVVATGDATEVGPISTSPQEQVDLTTPLTRKFGRFSRTLLKAILVVASLTFVAEVLRGRGAEEMFDGTVALAVGAIPEELPAIVTITLAIGVHRMARRRAIIRKLPAVEALGGTTVICSDKTGTLTQNRMTVQHLYGGGQPMAMEELWPATGSTNNVALQETGGAQAAAAAGAAGGQRRGLHRCGGGVFGAAQQWPEAARTIRAMAIFLTLGLIGVITGTADSPQALLWLFVGQFGVGTLAGPLTGRLATWAINRINLDHRGLYPLRALAFGLLAFGLAAVLGGSGFLAVYIDGIVLGSSSIVFRRGIFSFHDAIAWLGQIVLFVMLGLLSSAERIGGPRPALPLRHAERGQRQLPLDSALLLLAEREGPLRLRDGQLRLRCPRLRASDPPTVDRGKGGGCDGGGGAEHVLFGDLALHVVVLRSRQERNRAGEHGAVYGCPPPLPPDRPCPSRLERRPDRFPRQHRAPLSR